MTSPDTNSKAQRLLAALMAAGDVAYEWDLASDRIVWNGDIAAFLSPDKAGIANGRQLAEHIHPDDVERRRMRLENHWHAGVPFACEYRLRSSGDHIVWIDDRGSAER